jgi:hypothetical protein
MVEILDAIFMVAVLCAVIGGLAGIGMILIVVWGYIWNGFIMRR